MYQNSNCSHKLYISSTSVLTMYFMHGFIYSSHSHPMEVQSLSVFSTCFIEVYYFKFTLFVSVLVALFVSVLVDVSFVLPAHSYEIIIKMHLYTSTYTLTVYHQQRYAFRERDDNSMIVIIKMNLYVRIACTYACTISYFALCYVEYNISAYSVNLVCKMQECTYVF